MQVAMHKKGDVTMKFYSLLSVVFIVSNSVCSFAQAKDPNATEVLRRYKDSLSYLQSVSMRIKIDVDVDANHPNKWFCPYEEHFIFRQDNDRAEWLGQHRLFDDNGNIDPNQSKVIKQIITGDVYLGLPACPLNAPPRGALIGSDCEEKRKALLINPEYGGPLFGRMFSISQKSIAELLGQSTNLYLRNQQENINGVACYVLDATTKYGRVAAWIAPEKGYSTLKWSIHKSKTRGDLFDERPLSSNHWVAVFDSVEVQELNGVFVTTGGCLTLTINFTDERKRVSYHKYEVSEVHLNPDFDALGAFKIDLPDGTRVFVKESPGVNYVWQDGKIVPADDPTFKEIDKMVEQLKK
jgi:hypothetical protein